MDTLLIEIFIDEVPREPDRKTTVPYVNVFLARTNCHPFPVSSDTIDYNRFLES